MKLQIISLIGLIFALASVEPISITNTTDRAALSVSAASSKDIHFRLKNAQGVCATPLRRKLIARLDPNNVKAPFGDFTCTSSISRLTIKGGQLFIGGRPVILGDDYYKEELKIGDVGTPGLRVSIDNNGYLKGADGRCVDSIMTWGDGSYYPCLKVELTDPSKDKEPRFPPVPSTIQDGFRIIRSRNRCPWLHTNGSLIFEIKDIYDNEDFQNCFDGLSTFKVVQSSTLLYRDRKVWLNRKLEVIVRNDDMAGTLKQVKSPSFKVVINNLDDGSRWKLVVKFQNPWISTTQLLCFKNSQNKLVATVCNDLLSEQLSVDIQNIGLENLRLTSNTCFRDQNTGEYFCDTNSEKIRLQDTSRRLCLLYNDDYLFYPEIDASHVPRQPCMKAPFIIRSNKLIYYEVDHAILRPLRLFPYTDGTYRLITSDEVENCPNSADSVGCKIDNVKLLKNASLMVVKDDQGYEMEVLVFNYGDDKTRLCFMFNTSGMRDKDRLDNAKGYAMKCNDNDLKNSAIITW